MFQSLIDEFRLEYQQRIVIYEEFSNILEQFAKLDKRCLLDDSTKTQIYTLLQEKQSVTYQAIEVLIFEFLIQQPLEQEELRIDYDNLGPFAKKLPKDMLESITPEFLQQFTNFFKLISNKLGPCADWLEIEKLGRDVQRQSKVNTIELLRYIQPFVDAQRKVLVKDLLCLINDLERLQIGQSRVQTQISENQNQIKEKDIKDSSSEDEKKQTEKKDLANTIYQQADYLGRKYVKAEGQKLVGEICKAVQALEQQQKWMEQELEEKNKRMEEMNIQRELVQGALNQFDYDIKQKDQQMEQLLYDLDQLQAQLYSKMDLNDELVKKLENYNEELKQVSKYESEVRMKEIELKRVMEQNGTFQKEIERLTLNNKSLLQIIKELEQQGKEEQQIITKTETVIEYDDTEIKELQEKVNELQDYSMKMEQNNAQQDKQIIDLQRELTHYKGLYDNIFKENNQLRSSIMPRSSIRTSVLPNNTNRCSTLKIPFGNTNTHLSFIGRTSSNRYSSIKGNTGTIHSNFNPLDDLRQSNQLRIEEADDGNEQNPDQIMPPTIHIRLPPPRFDAKFQSSQLNQIKEEDDQEDQTIIQQDRISNNNDNVKNKNKMMWDLSAFLSNQNINEQDPKFYEFDENVIYATDFLGIREDKKIAEILKLERRTNNAIIQRCFSDSVYRIDHKGKKSRRIIFVTEFNVYIFEGETKPQKITRQFPIQNIHTIIFSESSPVLCSIQIAGSDDYLIETFKRSEFNTYLTEIFASRKFKLYQLDFRLNFKVKFKGQKEPIPIEQIQQRQGYLDHGKMSAYKVSSNKGSYSTNIGWLQLYSKKVFHQNWQEIFVLLTNVGLIIFKKPGDMEPILFISLVDALVIKNPITEYNKPHILKIRYETSQLEFHFSASSGTLLDQWHDLVQQVIMEQVKQQNKQLEQQQSDIVKQRTQTLIEQNNEITN